MNLRSLTGIVGCFFVMLANVTGASAQNAACSSPNRHAACSMQCCGRASCAPACEAECVKVCSDSCADPGRQSAFSAVLEGLRQRCGFKAPAAGR
jgi:hypothetical protein